MIDDGDMNLGRVDLIDIFDDTFVFFRRNLRLIITTVAPVFLPWELLQIPS